MIAANVRALDDALNTLELKAAKARRLLKFRRNGLEVAQEISGLFQADAEAKIAAQLDVVAGEIAAAYNASRAVFQSTEAV